MSSTRSMLKAAVAAAALVASASVQGADAAGTRSRTAVTAAAAANPSSVMKFIRGFGDDARKFDGLVDNAAAAGTKVARASADDVLEAGRKLIPKGSADEAAEAMLKRAEAPPAHVMAQQLAELAQHEADTLNHLVFKLTNAQFQYPKMAYQTLTSKVAAGGRVSTEILDVAKLLDAHARTRSVMASMNAKVQNVGQRAFFTGGRETATAQVDLLKAMAKRTELQNSIKFANGKNVPFQAHGVYLSVAEQRGVQSLVAKVLKNGDALTLREIRILRAAQAEAAAAVKAGAAGSASPVARALTAAMKQDGGEAWMRRFKAAMAEGDLSPAGYKYLDDLADESAAATAKGADEVTATAAVKKDPVVVKKDPVDEDLATNTVARKAENLDGVYDYPKVRYDLDLVDEAVDAATAKARNHVMFKLAHFRKSGGARDAPAEIVEGLGISGFGKEGRGALMDALDDVYLNGEKASNFNLKLINRVRHLTGDLDKPLKDLEFQKKFVDAIRYQQRYTGRVPKAADAVDAQYVAAKKAKELEAAKKADDLEAAKKAESAEIKALGSAGVKAVKNLASARARTNKLVAYITDVDVKRPYYNVMDSDIMVAKHWDQSLDEVQAVLSLDKWKSVKPRGQWGGELRDVRVSPWTHELMEKLQKQAEELAFIKQANGGKLPRGVQDMTGKEKETLDSLRKYFGGENQPYASYKDVGLKPMRDFDGYYYAPWQAKLFGDVKRTLSKGGEGLPGLLKQLEEGPLLGKFLRDQVRHGDTVMEISLRQNLVAHADEIHSAGVRLQQGATVAGKETGDAMVALADQLRNGVAVRKTVKDILQTPEHIRFGGQSELDRFLNQLLSDPNVDFNRQMLEQLQALRRSARTVSKGSTVNEEAALAVSAMFENKHFLWRLFGRQWDEPIGATAMHVTDGPLLKKWGDWDKIAEEATLPW